MTLCIVLCCLSFVGCSSSKESPKTDAASSKAPQVAVEEGVKSTSKKSAETAPQKTEAKVAQEKPKNTATEQAAPKTPVLQDLEKQPYTLAYRAPVKGDQQTRTTTMNMTMAMLVEGAQQRFDIGKNETRTSKSEVLDTKCASKEECVITKVRVEYVAAKLVDRNPMGSKEKSEPTVGNTYVVSVKDKELLVEDVTKKAVDPKALVVIKRDHRRLGEGDITRSLFPWGETMKPGDVHTPKAEAMKDFMRATKEDQKMEVGKASLTYLGFRKGTSGKEAVFDLKIPVEAEVQKGVNMTMNLVGNIVLQESTGWMVDLDVKSPFKVDLKQKSAKGQVTNISGEGQMKMGIDMGYPARKTP